MGGKDLSFSLVGRAESGPPRRSERGGRAKGGRRASRRSRRHVPNALRHGLSAMDSLMLDSFTTVSYATTRAFQNLWTKRSSHGSLAASASWAASSPISEVEMQIARRGHASRLVSLSSSALCSFGDEGLGANALWRRGGRLAPRRRFLHSSPGLTVTIRFQTTVCSGSKSSRILPPISATCQEKAFSPRAGWP